MAAALFERGLGGAGRPAYADGERALAERRPDAVLLG